jgi:hypothetical protein
MKIVDLSEQVIDVTEILELASNEPVMLIAADGKEYIIAEADDFAREVEQLRTNTAFQQFLDTRTAQGKRRIPLEDVARDIEAEIARESS